MDRRTFLKAGAAGAGAAALAACSEGGQQAASGGTAAPARTGRARRLNMVTAWPANFPGLGDMATRTARMIEQLTEGALEVRVYADGEVVPALEAFDAVSSGAADMYHAAEYYWQGKARGFSLFTAIPMGFTAQEMFAWHHFGGAKELHHELSAQFNVISFPAGNTTHQMGGWFRRRMETVEDFRGLRMRIPGLGGDVIQQLGATTVTLPGGEIFQAMQSGAIDATEWVGPWNDMAFGLHRVAQYYYGPGFHESGSALHCGINLGVWNSLSSFEQNAIERACDWATHMSVAEFTHQNALALQTLERDHGIQVQFFSDQIWQRFEEASNDVMSSIGNSDPLTRRIYESYLAAREQYLGWARVSDGPYLRHRQLAAERTASR